MRLSELARSLDLTRLTPVPESETSTADDTTNASVPTSPGAPSISASPVDTDPDITKGYASDLLSDVLANAPTGGVLVTLQVHLNVIAVAGHAGLAAVIFSSGREPEDEIIDKAAKEGIALFASPSDTFDLVGRLYSLGIRGIDA